MKLNYVVIALAVFFTAYIGNILTDPKSNWYLNLKLPSFTPPGYFIGIVWTIIFILCAISIMIIWNKLPHNNYFNWIIIIFIINAILNIIWSYLFFNQHLILASFIEMIVLEISIILLLVFVWPGSKTAALLLLPYAVWVCFATYLTYNILKLN